MIGLGDTHADQDCLLLVSKVFLYLLFIEFVMFVLLSGLPPRAHDRAELARCLRLLLSHPPFTMLLRFSCRAQVAMTFPSRNQRERFST